jgi:hypothetical protein
MGLWEIHKHEVLEESAIKALQTRSKILNLTQKVQPLYLPYLVLSDDFL